MFLTHELTQEHKVPILIANIVGKLNHELILHTHIKFNTFMISLPTKELNL